ncbi:MAG: FAD-dependent oxidoreductase [Dehalococcoidia bacterium]
MKYDVIIIGSGVGGMCAAALLADNGYTTLVVERQGRLGGRCSTEEVEGYKLSTGAVAIHRGGVLEDIYRKVGARLDLVDMPHQFYRTGSIEGQSYRMPAKGAISTLLELTNKLEKNRARMLGGMAREVGVEKFMSFFGRGVRGKEKVDDITFSDWLSRYTSSELVHKTFDAMACNVTGYHAYEITASEMFALFAGMGKYPALGVSPAGNEENLKSLADVVHANGGDVWTDCVAREILVEDGVSKGCVFRMEGQDLEVYSQAVVSNAGPGKTVRLVGEGNVGRDYSSLTQKLCPVGMILAHVASDEPLCLEEGELGGALLIGLRRLTSAFPLTNFSRELAPPGKHLLYCVGSPPSYLAPVDYEEEFEQTTLDLKEQFPKFESSGSILDFKIVFQDLPQPGMARIPYETPVTNLFNVGDGVQQIGSSGTSAAAESAWEVSQIIRKRIKPVKR